MFVSFLSFSLVWDRTSPLVVYHCAHNTSCPISFWGFIFFCFCEEALWSFKHATLPSSIWILEIWIQVPGMHWRKYIQWAIILNLKLWIFNGFLLLRLNKVVNFHGNKSKIGLCTFNDNSGFKDCCLIRLSKTKSSSKTLLNTINPGRFTKYWNSLIDRHYCV